jgi:hypothetical protein
MNEQLRVKITIASKDEGYWYYEDYEDQPLGTYDVRDSKMVDIAETLCSSGRAPEFIYEVDTRLTIRVEIV